MHFVLRALKKVQLLHPNIRLHIVSGDRESVLDALETGIADFGMLYTPTDALRYEFLEIPFDETWGIILPKSDPLATNNEIEMQELRDKPLILSRSMSPQVMRDGLDGLGWRDFKLVGTYNLLFNASLMVEDGLGYALALDHILHFAPDSPLCFRPLAGGSHRMRPLENFPFFRINLAWRRDRMMSRAAEALLDAIREECTSLST